MKTRGATQMFKFIMVLLLTASPAFAAQQTINNGETFLQVRTKINENFTELYDRPATAAELESLLDDYYGNTNWRTQDGYEANTDNQSLSFSSPNLSISGGNSVDLSSLESANELTPDELAAVNGASSPNAGNVFATMTDVNSAGGGDLLSTNNLSDLTDANAARTNLGLGTAAATDSTAYATAAQGATADTALQPADMTTHTAAADPHPGYMLKSNIGTSANNYIQLDSNGDLPFAIGFTAPPGTGNLAVTDDTLEELAVAVDGLATGGTDDQTAAEVPITDSGGYFTGTDVEAALQEIGAAGTGGATAMNDLTDADTATTAPSSGDVLKWDGTNWTPGTDNTAAGAGYTATPPTYSDEACTPGQYAFNTTTGFVCVASGDWNTFSLTDWNNPTSTAGTLAFSPTSWDAADGTEGDTTATQTVTLTATGDVTLSGISLGGSNYFSNAGTGSCTTSSVLSDSSCTIDLAFAYTTAGTYSDTLTVTSNATDSPETASLGSTVVSAGGLTCTDLANITRDDYWNFGYDNMAQAIKYGGGCAIDKVGILIEPIGNITVHVEIWTTADKSLGTQIGGDSDSRDFNYSGTYTMEDFTWSSNNPTPTGDYFIHVAVSAGTASDLKWGSASGGTAYEDTNYDMWRGNDGSVAEISGDVDAGFTVTYQ